MRKDSFCLSVVPPHLTHDGKVVHHLSLLFSFFPLLITWFIDKLRTRTQKIHLYIYIQKRGEKRRGGDAYWLYCTSSAWDTSSDDIVPDVLVISELMVWEQTRPRQFQSPWINVPWTSIGKRGEEEEEEEKNTSEIRRQKSKRKIPFFPPTHISVQHDK